MENKQQKGRAIINWKYDAVSHDQYTDLGRYIIDLGTIDQAGTALGISMVNSRVDSSFSAPSCTGVVKRSTILIPRQAVTILFQY